MNWGTAVADAFQQLSMMLPPGEDPDRSAPTRPRDALAFVDGFNAARGYAMAVNEDRPSPLLSRGRGLGALLSTPVRRSFRGDAASPSASRGPIGALAQNRLQEWNTPDSDPEASDNDDVAANDRGLVQLVGADPTSLQVAAWILEGAGYQVRAHNSALALLAEIDHSRPCCLLLDIDTPDLSGLEVQAELKRRGVLWPVIMTGQAKIGGVVQAMKNGALDFVETPFDSRALLEALEEGFAKVEHVREQSQRMAIACAMIDRLTAREREVMSGLLAGLPNKLIARKLNLSVRTVEIYRATVLSKLQVRSISSIVKLAIDAGLEPLMEDWKGF